MPNEAISTQPSAVSKPIFVDLHKLAKREKFYITEIMNDLHRYGYVEGGKADTLLRGLASELRDRARPVMPPSKLKRTFYEEVGKENW